MKTVEELAREADLSPMSADSHCREDYWTATRDELSRFRDLVLEEAAKVCDELAELNRKAMTDSMWQQEECASAIRQVKVQK